MKLIFGCGYLGERVAHLWRRENHTVAVVTRSPARAVAFERKGFAPIIADVTRPESLSNLPAAETVLFAVGLDRTAGQSIQQVHVDGLRHVLASLPSRMGRFLHISTTGVYGDAAGEWVDERTPPAPQREGGRAALAAEQLLGEHPLGAGSVILRLAGLYGPGRVPHVEQLRAGEPIAAPASGALNLIHVEDAARIVLAADALPPFQDGPRLYCVSDGRPVDRGEYITEVARNLGAPTPRFAPPDADSPRVERAQANRRIANTQLVRDLHVSLRYPDYRAGLKAILSLDPIS